VVTAAAALRPSACGEGGEHRRPKISGVLNAIMSEMTKDPEPSTSIGVNGH